MSCCIDDPPTMERVDYPTARIEHKCCECGAAIKPGDQYQLIVGLYDGNWYRTKSCEPCADLRDSLSQVWCTYIETLRDDYKDFCDETGRFRWSDDEEEIIYPENHMNLNGART